MDEELIELREQSYRIEMPKECCFYCTNSDMACDLSMRCHVVASDKPFHIVPEGYCKLFIGRR